MRASEDQLRQWMIGGQRGDAANHRALLAALVPLLQAFYRRRMRDAAEDVEDLVQETLIAVHTRRATYDPDRPFGVWLFAIARYKMIDLLRAKSGREALHDPLDDEVAVFADSATEASDARRDQIGRAHV